MYPVMLDVKNQRCLVIGGGSVASRKVRGLLAEGALVRVVARVAEAPVRRLADEGAIQLVMREYRPSDLEGVVLVFAATDDREVNRRIWKDARGRGLWVNVADAPEYCTFHLPARVKRGSFQVAIASAGDAPFLVRRFREYLETRIGPEWRLWIAAARRFRDDVRQQSIDSQARERLFDTFFRATFDPETLQVRIPHDRELAELAREGHPAPRLEVSGAKAVPLSTVRGERTPRAPGLGPADVGFVSLVGAGPGDPDLLTLKGRRRLEEADAIVYDRLSEPAMPADLERDVALFPVGKRPLHHPVPQDEIGRLMVRLAREGKRVVRLKGGDPLIFGRGGEEAEVLVQAGIPFEIVPAPTAGVAAAAYAGIPVTHRNEAVRLTLITAHESLKQSAQLRWDLIARDPHATLVGYMGVGNLPGVVDRLLVNGMPPDTPAAMIERGTTSTQRTIRSRLEDLPREAAKAGIRPPALFVIGSTVAHAPHVDWFTGRPLHGERLLVAAPPPLLRDTLERAGVAVVPVRLPVTAAARVAVASLPVTGVLLTSAEDTDAFCNLLEPGTRATSVTAWCMTPEAHDRARDQEWRRVVLVEGSMPEQAKSMIAAMVRARAQ